MDIMKVLLDFITRIKYFIYNTTYNQNLHEFHHDDNLTHFDEQYINLDNHAIDAYFDYNIPTSLLKNNIKI